MSYEIPFDIQTEILKRLPVKSLIRFRSVSKPWKSVISSSKFVINYKARHPDRHGLFVTCFDSNYKEKHVLIVDDDTFPSRKLSNTIPSSVNLLDSNQLFGEPIIGSSHGLLCFYGVRDRRDAMAVIWNPSIRKSVDILVESSDSRRDIAVGFGVCPRTFDPMLVKITYKKPAERDFVGYHPLQVEIFTLSSGAWKSRSINLPRKSISLRDYNVDLDGFIYWLATDREFESRNMIMSFDMRSENFVEISLPDCLLSFNTYLSISKRMESLVVLEYEYDHKFKKQIHHVWMMEGSVQKSFTKLFTIEAPEASISSVLGFRNSGEPIIAMDIDGSDFKKLGVYLYEPNTRHISDIGISEPYLCSASSYTETLLLLDE